METDARVAWRMKFLEIFPGHASQVTRPGHVIYKEFAPKSFPIGINHSGAGNSMDFLAIVLSCYITLHSTPSRLIYSRELLDR